MQGKRCSGGWRVTLAIFMVTLFAMSTHAATEKVVHNFNDNGKDGYFPHAGLIFDKAGNLYVAGCFQGRHGIVRISPDGKSAKQFVAGNNVVGLCFTRAGEMIVATNDSVYSVPCGIEGTLL